MKRKGIAMAWLILVLAFLYLPILILMIYSFTKSTTIGALRSFSLQNYVTLFTTPDLTSMIWGTVSLAVLVSLISTFLGTMGAVGIFYSRRLTRKGMEIVNQIPVVNADVVTGFSVCVLLIVFLNMDKDTYIPLVVGLASLCTPFVYLSVTPRLKQMDPNLYEAALDLGCTPARALWKVVVPELVPGILSGFMTSITLTLDDYFITTYTKPAVFNTISTYVVNATKGAQTQIKTALWALSTVIFLVVVVAVVIMNLLPGGVDSIGKKGSFEVYKREGKGNGINSGTGIGMGGGLKSLMLVLLLTGAVMTTCTGCGNAEDKTLVLRVANCEEYIDEGDWDEEEVIELDNGEEIIGENRMVDDFCEWYEEVYGEKIKVEYSTYGTNEDLYNQLTLGNQFDLVCPSEYMIMKFMEENRLEPYSRDFYDGEKEYNYYAKGVSPYIKDVFDKLSFNGEPVAKYGAGYMWGNMGIVYNPEYVDADELKHWDALLNPKYSKRITMKDGVRDSYFIALGILNADKIQKPEFLNASDYSERLAELMNDTSQETVDKAETVLSEMRKNAYSLETDSGKADMITGKVVANMQWSGDAVYSMDQAEEDGAELAYAVPEECTNLWFDGWVMLKDGLSEDSRKQQAAEAFVNFLSRPDNVVRNMYYIGYTSAIAGGDDDTIFEYLKYCYGAEDEDDAVEYDVSYFFRGLDEEATSDEAINGELPDSIDEESQETGIVKEVKESVAGTKNADKYILLTDVEQLHRQLFAQYPPLETIKRSAVMKCYSYEANQRISQMWINIRCYDMQDLIKTFTKK